MADLNRVTNLEDLVVNADAIHDGAVAAAQIANMQPPLLAIELRVLARDSHVAVQAQAGLATAADATGQRLHPQLLPSLRARYDGQNNSPRPFNRGRGLEGRRGFWCVISRRYCNRWAFNWRGWQGRRFNRHGFHHRDGRPVEYRARDQVGS